MLNIEKWGHERTLEEIKTAKRKKATTLDLSVKQITTLPPEIAELQNLIKLDLRYNQLTELPPEIGELKNLKTLYLSKNQLTALPPEISKLKNLTTLFLSSNQLTELSPEIADLKELTSLLLPGNPIEIPPPEILKTKTLGGKELKAVSDYYRQLKAEGLDYIYEAKLLIIGEGGAGKTTFAKKIESPRYSLQNDEESTRGIDVIKWKFPLDKGRHFHVNIWDFGGQEIYHTTHQFFLTKRSLYALVADTRKEDTDFYYWLNVVELLADDSPLLIIKNEKQDRQREINERQLRGRFPNLQSILRTNLATNRGLDNLMTEIRHRIMNLPHVGTPLPKTWVRVREALEKDSHNYISQEEFRKICRRHLFTNSADQMQLSGYLHDLGVILHFQDDPVLKHIVILKPKWGTDAVYKVLDDPFVINNLGKFTRENLDHIWADPQYADKQDELLRLMIKFNLCYEIPGSNDTFIAPQLLTENNPEYEWIQENNLHLRYSYEFMPKGILTRFIVAMHPLIKEQKYVWKSGVILEKGHTEAEIFENWNRRELKIRITGNDKKGLMTIVIHELGKIHHSYNNLKYDKLVPCNCNNCRESSIPYFYPFKVLQKFKADKQPNIQCQKYYIMVDVLSLIEDIDRISTGPEKELFISYAWGGESKKIVDQLEAAFIKREISVKRDKNELEYKDNIDLFMQQLSRGRCVIAIISEKYLHSDNCMYELVKIADHGDFYDRIFPIILKDANIYKPISRIAYVKYWEGEIKKLEESLREVSAANMKGIQDDLNLYSKIRQTIVDLMDTLKKMNALTPEIHRKEGFDELIKKVTQKLSA